jgi:hypothetical protein
MVEVGWIDLAYDKGAAVGFFEHGYECLGFIKCG